MSEVDADKELLRMVTYIAGKAARSYADWTTYDDLYQEVYMYAFLTQRHRIDKWTADQDTTRVFRALFGVAKQYAEKEKAVKSGYDFSDLHWYTPQKLADLIPIALNDGWDGLTGLDNEQGMPGGKGIAFEGGSLLAMVMDLRAALVKTFKNGLKMNPTDFDISDPVGRGRLEKLAENLGGEYPDAPGYSRGRRKVKSNAAAVHETGEAA